MKLAALYESVTASIVAELERGAVPWSKMWTSAFPENAITHRPYAGINVVMLLMAAQRHGYESNGWLTFKQALAANACVRKGEKATPVVFAKKLVHEDEEDKKARTVLRVFYVFNRSQIDGLTEAEAKVERTADDGYAAVGAFVAATGARIRFGPFEPCYVPAEDIVCVPERKTFKGDEHYYATVLHELCHWTGPRLKRELRHRFGTREYAAEELIAELGAAFLCAHLGIHGELRHAGYVENWLQLLKHDDRAIFSASAKASEAANFLRAYSEPKSDE